MLARPVAYRPAPNASAAPSANHTARGSSLPASSRSAGGREARTTPTATIRSPTAVQAPSVSPAATAITAATAPSEDEIGATTPTFPIRRPV